MAILGARRDADGFLWVTGRVDDMLNVSGHLMSTSEVESVLTEHPRVSESAVVSRPHPVKGECLYCFVTPKENETFDKKMTDELKVLVRERIGGKIDGVDYDFFTNIFISTFQVHLHSPTSFNTHRDFPKPDLAKSCDASSERLQLMTKMSVTFQH